ncbi:MAG: ATP-binding cassette domain-containing protein [Clostridiales bacterium]|nr:ATP-binding cassette domain-containing protein [Clostridiales bacterium]
MEKLLEFKNVRITLKNRVLFENISFIFHEGERLMLSGENGSGKSLLLELIALGMSKDLCERYSGLEVTGEILDANGNDLLDPETGRKVAYVAQSEETYKNSTLVKQAEIAANGVGIDLDEDKLDYLLDRFGLSEKKNQKLKNNLSFGQGKLVHIITRLLKLPATNLLVLDEPLNHLSFKNSKVLNDIMLEEIKNNPKLSIIMVSHCNAISFVNQKMVYDYDTNRMVKKQYHSYDCFE